MFKSKKKTNKDIAQMSKEFVDQLNHEALKPKPEVKEAPKSPQPNEVVAQIADFEKQLSKLKQQVCTHEPRYKNGLKPTYFQLALYDYTREEFNDCVHCGAKIKAEKWLTA